MVAYSYLMQNTETGRYVEVLADRLHEILERVAASIQVDEKWYRENYRDVAEAIERGDFDSGREHYVRAGYFENRFPRRIAVDEAWYLAAYADVSQAIEMGSFRSGQHHFEMRGFCEGRLAAEGWSLRTSDDVAAEKPARLEGAASRAA